MTDLRAPAGERPLREDDVGVVGGIPIAGAVADEDDDPTTDLVSADALALAGAAHEAGRVAEGEGHAVGAGHAVLVGRDGQVGQRRRQPSAGSTRRRSRARR